MIDTSTWKEFRVGDLFEVTYGIFKAKSESIDKGGIPHITTTQYNNGIGYYVKSQMFPAHCITVASDGCQGASFYHTYPISASNIVSVCVPHNDVPMNEIIGNFLCSLFRKEGEKYSWGGFKYSVDRVRETRLHLPATPDGQPDWDYMESYMKAVMEESEKSLENLRKADDTKHLIDVNGWGAFSCKELFECKNTGNILARDVIDGSGNTPYVTASGYNNGVVAHIDASNYEIIKGHCILVGGKTFTITYQKDAFVSNDSHNFTIRVKDYDISDLAYLYLASMIYTYFGQKYSWNDAVTKDKLFDESIPLPITSTGEPDWDYMEDYMRRIMDKSEQIISDLQNGA